MKQSLLEKIESKAHKICYYAMNPGFAIKYNRRFSEGFTQKDLEYCVAGLYKYHLGKELDFNNVRTFNEKLNWLKCFYHDDAMTECADKVLAPAFFMKNTGLDETYIVKNLGIYDSPNEIEFDNLPEKFVLKSNWGSGKQIIVENKEEVSFNNVKRRMSSWCDRTSNHYFFGFEYGYKNIVPKIVCEEFVDFEYKLEFFCFDGKPEFFWTVYNDKTDNVCANFYNAETHQKMKVKQGYPNSPDTIDLPKEYEQMKDIASKLSKEFPFVRIDFFKTSTGFKFSEMTFYHWSGLKRFEPDSYDLEFGKLIELPKKKI